MKKLRIHPIWIAVAISLALLLWLLSGNTDDAVTEVAQPTSTTPATNTATPKPINVVTRHSTAQPIHEEVVLNGHTTPARAVDVRVETAGRVAAIALAEGSQVNTGDTLIQIAMNTRKIERTQARALVEQRELEYNAAVSLAKRNLQAKTKVAQAKSNLATARTQLAKIAEDIANTRVRAPFDGIFSEQLVEVGSYVTAGQTIARVLQTNPLLAVANLVEKDVTKIRLGQNAIAILRSGVELSGNVRYIANEADDKTRTFRVEIAIPNANYAVRAGMSAELRIPVSVQQAHRVPTSLLSLDAKNRLGIKTVDTKQQVVFNPIAVLKTVGDDLWVTGLPAHANIIVVGHGFVQAGDKVNPTDENQPPAKAVDNAT